MSDFATWNCLSIFTALVKLTNYSLIAHAVGHVLEFEATEVKKFILAVIVDLPVGK